MRILYHHRTQGQEPEGIHIQAIVDALRGLGHELRVVGPAVAPPARNAQPRESLAGRVKRAVPQWAFELIQLGYNAVVYLRLWREVRDFKPDLIYERYALFNFAGVLLARRHRVPLILEVNTPYAQAWAKYYGLYLRGCARWIERKTLVAADHVITVTEAQREMLLGIGIDAECLSVCHNAIDPAWFDPDRHDPAPVREALGLHGLVVGFVGTMNRWQGITEFPGVLREVLARCPDVQFLFVGDGEFRGKLETFCREEGFAGRVVFAGRKAHQDIPPLVAAMDIAILLNSNQYGSPMKIFEYLGMAKAVIAPGVRPVKEVLADGVTGLIIEPGDAPAMARTIIRLAGDPALRQGLGSAGRSYVVGRHTWRMNAQKIIEVHAQILAKRR